MMVRPREFDSDEVLDQAMEVFWRHGYDGASMAELAKAMHLNAPSIYAAFGSKRGLFDAVLDRYQQRRQDYGMWVLNAPTAKDVAHRMLFGAIDWLTDLNEPPGCLLFQAGLASAVSSPEIPQILAARRAGVVAALAERFKKAKGDGDLAPEADATALAKYLQTIFCGLAIQAAAGARKADLQNDARRALIGWPDGKGKRLKKVMRPARWRTPTKGAARDGKR